MCAVMRAKKQHAGDISAFAVGLGLVLNKTEAITIVAEYCLI